MIDLLLDDDDDQKVWCEDCGADSEYSCNCPPPGY